MAGEAWFGLRWLDAVREHPERTRYACIAANALAPYTDNKTGEAKVALATMAGDQRQPTKALQRGFDDLGRIGLLDRSKRRKEGSMEWDTTLYRPLLPTRRSIPAYGKRPDNYSMSVKPITGSKRPTGETHKSKRPTGDEPSIEDLLSEAYRVEGDEQRRRAGGGQ